jgi:TolB-like protein
MTRVLPLGRSALVLVLLAIARATDAQCPDGSPPPCRTTAVPATPRRVNPPLDDRTWIVVPFDNLANNSEVDWLRAASVNLLYLDMSRWRDIKVVDDERVADLIREVPEASGSKQSMSLNAGLAVAKRAGAGRLVMGDVLRLGSRTAVTAKVFDVRTGQRTKSVREETAVPDSVMSLFGKLAQKVLNVAPPQGANVGALGTTRVDAYQEYIAGVDALNRFDLGEARRHMVKAIALDSTFALAHFKMSIIAGWESANSPERRPHAEAAARFAAGLPPRERVLITGQLLQSRDDWTKACETYTPLARADSSDIEAWYGMGECLFHDRTIEAVGGDTTRLRFRADLDQSIRAFQRVLQLDPTYHLAYQHIIDALTADRHAQAGYCGESGGGCTQYSALLIRVGDSLVATPFRVVQTPQGSVHAAIDSAKVRELTERYARTRSRRRNLQIANETANAWVASAPDELRARAALVHVLLSQGRTGEAATVIARAGTGTITDQLNLLLARIEVAYKQGRGSEAVRLYDSLRATPIPVPGSSGVQMGNAMAQFAPAFGRMVEFDSLISAQLRSQPLMLAYQRELIRAAFVGAVRDSMMRLERVLFDQINGSSGVTNATRAISPSLVFGLRLPRASWPAVDTSIADARIQPVFALMKGDTAKLRAAARTLESKVATAVETAAADSGFAILAAESYLALNDSASALRALRMSLDSAVATTRLFPLQNQQGNLLYLLPRMMLLRADLAAAAGQREEARTWYKRFSDVWSTAAPELQPLVERARRGLQSP